VPVWLSTRMAALGRVIVEAIAQEYGCEEVLRRLAQPFWFQSFGAVMGMDWHSSGITTSVVGALKKGLAPIQRELGLYVCGATHRASSNASAMRPASMRRRSLTRADSSPRSTGRRYRMGTIYICMRSS
jgi:hypothetical protein